MSNEIKNELRQPKGLGAETCSPAGDFVIHSVMKRRIEKAMGQPLPDCVKVCDELPVKRSCSICAHYEVTQWPPTGCGTCNKYEKYMPGESGRECKGFQIKENDQIQP